MIHPLDRIRFQPEKQLIEDLIERFSLEPLLQHHEQSPESAPERELVLSTQLRLTPILAPRLSALFDEVRSRLQFVAAAELFVHSDANVNGFSLYSFQSGQPHIVSLTSGMIERMNDDELRFVLGHELGHLYFGHHRPRLVYAMLGQNEEGDSRLPPLLQRRMETWERLAELSADRAGFVAVEGKLEPVVSAFFKMISGLGPEHLQFDIDAFLHQLEDLQMMKRRDVLARFSHPLTPVRVRALQLFGEAGGCQVQPGIDVQSGEWSALDAKVSDLARLMDFEVTEPLDVRARDFLLAAGMLAIDADREGMSDQEHRVLIQLLLPVTSDPEELLKQLGSRKAARAMLQQTSAWLRENAGEERFELFRQIAHLVAVDGVVNAKEKAFMLSLGRALHIPTRAATEMLYEVLTGYLQSRPPGQASVFESSHRSQRVAGTGHTKGSGPRSSPHRAAPHAPASSTPTGLLPSRGHPEDS